MAAECIFCQIISGQAPAEKLYEDDQTIVIMDIFPWAKGHCLVISKEHAPTVFELSEGSAQAVMSSVKTVAPALVEAVGADGLNLFQSNGQAAWQSVDHFHMHLLPRWDDDGLQPPGVPRPANPGDLEEIGASIVKAIRTRGGGNG